MKQAKAERFRARSAYKLMAIDDKHHFLKQGSIVVRFVDLSIEYAMRGWQRSKDTVQ